MKNNKFEKLLFSIFLLIGIIGFVVGIIVCINAFNNNNKVVTKGTITKIDVYKGNDGKRSYDVYVSYDVNGEEYESQLSGYSSSFYEGETLEIYYYKNNPRFKLNLIIIK